MFCNTLMVKKNLICWFNAVNEAEKTVKQIKKIPTVWSTITSSAIL